MPCSYPHRKLDCCGSPEGIEDLRKTIEKLNDAGLGHTAEWLDNEEEIAQRVPWLAGNEMSVSWDARESNSNWFSLTLA